MVASKLHLPIFVPPPVRRLHEFRATSTFLFWCWGPELGFSYLHSQLPYLGRHLSSISFSFLFCLLQEGPRTSPLLGRHCTTEPHSQNSPLLKHFQMSVTEWLLPSHHSYQWICARDGESPSQSQYCMCISWWLTVALTSKWKILEMSSSWVVEYTLWQRRVVILLWVIVLRMINL